MSGLTTRSAIFLLVIGNALAVMSDVLIKLADHEIPVFQFVFLRSLFGVFLLLLAWKQILWTDFFAGVRLHSFRAIVHLMAIAAMVIALQNLPLATANAIFYAAPLLVVALAVIFVGEKASRLSLLAVLSGFVGVIVILRPVEFGWGAIMALVVAFALAISAITVRYLPSQQSTVHRMMVTTVLVLPFSLALAIWENADILVETMWIALGSTVFTTAYNMSVLKAYRHVDANQVTSAEYTGLIWAILIGWWWFAEVPDTWFILGTSLIVLPLLALSLRRNTRAPQSRKGAQSQMSKTRNAGNSPQVVVD